MQSSAPIKAHHKSLQHWEEAHEGHRRWKEVGGLLCWPSLTTMAGTAKPRQCQSCFHVLPAQLPCPSSLQRRGGGSGALPTLAPLLEAGLGLSTPWQGCEPTGGTCPHFVPSCDHWKHFIFLPWIVLGYISSFPCMFRKVARDYYSIEKVPNNLKNKRFPAHAFISTGWEEPH